MNWMYWADKAFLKALEKTRYGSLDLEMPDGKLYHFEGKETGPRAHMHIHQSEAFFRFILKGDIGVAETYRDGLWDSNDIELLMQFGMLNEDAMSQVVYGTEFFRAIGRLLRSLQANTLRGSKKNIAAHYDLGNAFYQLWLDESMTYSSALFKQDNDTLEQAQHQKYDRILDRIGDVSGDVLEIGCGWGGFGERAISKKDHRVSGLTLSEEQHAYATSRLAPYGKQGNILLQDYRAEQGKYDHIVSIEMLEAVGERYWKTYFEKISAALKTRGKAVIQTITIDEPYFDIYRKGSDFIRTYIFPGGMLPAESRLEQTAAAAGLMISDRFSFTKDYAKTLRMWLKSFQAKESALDAMGFDKKFRRMWSLYLAACAASFEINRTHVVQLEFVHA